MMIVQRLEDLAQAQIQECASRAVAKFKPSVRPIYGLARGSAVMRRRSFVEG